MSIKLDSLPPDLRLVADELIENKFPNPVNEVYKHTFSSFTTNIMASPALTMNEMLLINGSMMNNSIEVSEFMKDFF